ncbi:MAG TPA: hypothetical protein VMD52_07200 [Patescibacteria group bacterium]|nr:hypothetical protein [Patescibacteria group bacterium]
MKKITVLGDGQVWDVRGIDPAHPGVIFEDVFCGRVLEEKARLRPGIFGRYIEKGKAGITGMSVTLALLDRRNRKAQEAALAIVQEVAASAGSGIAALAAGRGYKPGWTRQESALWKGLSCVIIGGGVSRGKTGSIVVAGIKDRLAKEGLGNIAVTKARFPGKESGFLGAAVNVLEVACRQTKARGLSRAGVISIDLGRDKTGVGILMVNPRTCGIIKNTSFLWKYRFSVRTVRSNSRIKCFAKQKSLGLQLRARVIHQLAGLIIRAKAHAEKIGIAYSTHVGLALPGEASADGYLLGSTDYLPFFTKKDGFHFTAAVENELARCGFPDFHLHIVNDGIAAGLANIKLGFDLKRLKDGKYAFLGPGSGLGGCLCRVKEVR